MENLEDLLDYLETLGPGHAKTVCDEKGIIPLHEAAFANNVVVAKRLIKLGCEIDAKNHNGLTPFDIAVYYDNVEVAEVLVKAGASLEHSYLTTQIGSPLNCVVIQGSLKMLKMLINSLDISSNCNIDARSPEGYTPLVNAIIQNRLDVVKVLIEAGCDLTAKDLEGYTPLVNSIKVCCHGGSSESYEIAKLLIEASTDINHRYDDTMTVLHRAAAIDKDFRLIPLLLEKGADINAIDSFGFLPIHAAITANNYCAVEGLIEAGSRIDWLSPFNNTILHYALEHRNPKVIKLLCEKGASVHAVNDDDLEPFSCGVLWFRSPPILYTNGSESWFQDTLKCLKLLLKQGSDINRVSSKRDTILNMALSCDELDSRIITFLLDNKAVVNFNDEVVQDTIDSMEKSEISRSLIKHATLCRMQSHSNEQIKNFDLDKMTQELQDHYRVCEAELEMMKQWPIVENEFSLCDILAAKKISHYVRNENTLQVIEKVSSLKLFPIYIGDLCRRFEKEKKKQKRLDEARNGLSRLIKWDVSSFSVVYDNILRYLPKSDLHNLSLI